MEILKELSVIITKNKTKSIRIIDHFDIPKTKMEKFFHGLREQTITNDDEALKELYPDHDKRPNSKNNYYKLKYDLRDKLLNTLLFIDSSFVRSSKREHMGVKIRKYTTYYYVSTNVKMPKTTKWLFDVTIKMAIEYDYWNIVVEISFNHSLNFAHRTKTALSNNEFFKVHQDYDNRLQALRKIQILKTEIERRIVSGKSFEALINYIDAELANIKILPKHKMSHLYLTNLSYIKLIKYSALYDYTNCLKVCNDFIKTSKKITYLDGYIDNGIFMQKIEASIQLNLYQSGLKTTKLLIEQTNPTTYAYMCGVLAKILLHLKNNNILDANKIKIQYQSIIHEAKLRNIRVEYWKIIIGWFHFLDEIETIDKKNPEISFNIFKLANNSPETTRNKLGNYISLLFLEICFLILKKDYNKLIDKVESLRRYKNRYFKEDKNLRVKTFIDMLILLSKNNFEIKPTLDKTKEHYLLLQEMTLEKSKQDMFKEIVPLEMVWEKIIAYLD